MKIGDEIFVHGYVEEIVEDIIIVRNEGGYFGTVESEIRLADDVISSRVECEWIEKDYRIVCSKCGGQEDTFIHGYGEWETYGESDYCPNCGAKRKEKE